MGELPVGLAELNRSILEGIMENFTCKETLYSFSVKEHSMKNLSNHATLPTLSTDELERCVRKWMLDPRKARIDERNVGIKDRLDTMKACHSY